MDDANAEQSTCKTEGVIALQRSYELEGLGAAEHSCGLKCVSVAQQSYKLEGVNTAQHSCELEGTNAAQQSWQLEGDNTAQQSCELKSVNGPQHSDESETNNAAEHFDEMEGANSVQCSGELESSNEFSRNSLDEMKQLFAETLVRFTMTINGSHIRFSSAISRKPFILSQSMLMAIFYLDKVLIEEVAHNVTMQRQNGLLTLEGFESYSKSLIESFKSQEHSSESILKPCMYVALTALYYYREGITKSPYIAVELIARALDSDLIKGGWNMLQKAAENFEFMMRSIHTTSPEDTDFDELSEGDLSPDQEDPMDNEPSSLSDDS